MTAPTYLYRCTEQQMEEHLARIAEAGDAVEHVIYKGGRDYVLVCRRASEERIVKVRLVTESAQEIADLVNKAAEKGRRMGERIRRAQ